MTLASGQWPEPLPRGPTAVLASCPAVTLFPSDSLWRLPASLSPVNHVCAGFIFSSNLFQRMQSGCARRWAGRSAAARVTEPGFTVKLTGTTCTRPRPDTRPGGALGWDTREPRDQPHSHITTTSGPKQPGRSSLAHFLLEALLPLPRLAD